MRPGPDVHEVAGALRVSIGLLEHLWRERGLTLVLVTHDTSLARQAQRVGVMSKGRLTIKQDNRPAPRPDTHPVAAGHDPIA